MSQVHPQQQAPVYVRNDLSALPGNGAQGSELTKREPPSLLSRPKMQRPKHPVGDPAANPNPWADKDKEARQDPKQRYIWQKATPHYFIRFKVKVRCNSTFVPGFHVDNGSRGTKR